MRMIGIEREYNAAISLLMYCQKYAMYAIWYFRIQLNGDQIFNLKDSFQLFGLFQQNPEINI